MGKVVRIIQGAAMIAAGIVTANPVLIAQGVMTVTSALLTPGAKAPRAQATNVQIGEVPRSGVFGEAAVPGSLVDAYNHGGKYGTDWTVLILALADHECEDLVGFWVTDKYVAFTGDGIVPGYRDQLAVYWRPGTWDQSLPSYVTSTAPNFPSGHPLAGQPTWTSDDRGRGVAYVVVAYKADKSDAKNPVWTAGRPVFSWVVKGLKVYSARDDDTVAGGSGAHRWDDPSTREWSNNLIDCRYTWVRGIYAGNQVDDPGMLLLGRGLSAIEAPPENVAAPANVCDEPVALKAGGTEPRYRANGSWSADQAWIEVEEMFAAACGGVVLEREGSVEIEPGQAKAPVFTFTDADLVIGTTVNVADLPSRTDDEWVNTVSVRYYEPTQKYKQHTAPVRRVDADVIADNGPREATPDLTLVTSGTQAQRVGEMHRRLGRKWKRRSVVLGPRFAALEHGDWGVWDSARHGEVLVRAQSEQVGEDWRNSLALREMDDAFDDWDAETDELDDKSVAVDSATPGGVGEPDAGNWSIAIEDGALVIEGAATDDEYATAIIFEYSIEASPDPDVDGDWQPISTGSVATTRAVLPGIATDTDYYGAVSYFVGLERGDRLVLGPVNEAAVDLPPAEPTLFSATGGTGEAVLEWRNPTSANFGYVKLFRGATAVFGDAAEIAGPLYGGLGEVMTWADTVAAGTYYYWVQSFSAADIAADETGPETATVS